MSYAGASYQITNNPNGNHLIIRKILNDGTSQFSSIVPTYGTGTAPNVSDPLFSQDSTIRYKNTLFVVNAGSNSVSMFRINPYNPIDITLVNMISTGSYPVSLAANSKYLAVLTGGENSGINFYTWNESKSIINPLSDWNRSIQLNPVQTTPPSGPMNTVSDIIFSPDDKSIIVSYKGYDESRPGGVLIYPIKDTGLSDKPVKCILQGAALPFSITPVGNNSLLVTDAAKGFYVFSYNSSTGDSTSTPVFSVPAQQGKTLCWSTYSKQTGNYYLIGTAGSNVIEVNIDQNLQATIVKSYKIPNNLGNITDVNTLNIKGIDYLYINAPGDKSVIVIKLTGPGNASIIQIDKSLPNSVEVGSISGMTLVDPETNNNEAITIWVWVLLLVIFIFLIIGLIVSRH